MPCGYWGRELVVGNIYRGNAVQVITALAALAGHSWPIYAGFRGGKGVATVLGGLLVISPVTFLATVVVAFILIAKYRYVSLGSVVGAITAFLVLSLHTFLTSGPIIYFPYAVIGTSLVIFRHRDNIRRLTMGTEARIGGGARS
ncbi:MAG: hypothetical protein HW403_1474 [Dehalococcoidia bacterium]|nr:hypothetical protein [Dehalococcoidia bacterium]